MEVRERKKEKGNEKERMEEEEQWNERVLRKRRKMGIWKKDEE